MKNKKLMLIAVAAMGFVALGAAGVGTFAWYTASAATTVNKQGASNNALRTEASSTTLGSFKLTVTLGAPSPTTIGLSDDNGDTFVYATGQVATGKEIAASHDHLYSSIAVGVTLSYTGDLATAAEKDLAWQASVPASVTITITDTTEGLASGEGLKFFKDSEPTKTTNGYKGSASVNWVVANTSLDDLNFATPSLSHSVGTLYVAAKGVDNLDQSSGHTYVVNAVIA